MARKLTSQQVRAKARRKADKLWSVYIRQRDGGCVICGLPGQAHHLIRRNATFYRHNPENGVSLCPKHHQFDNELSAHGAPWAFEAWMKEHRPDQFAWWAKNRCELVLGVKVDYSQVCETLQALTETLVWTGEPE